MIAGAGNSDAEAKINFPVGRYIKIDRRKNLMLLLIEGKKAGDRPNRSVIFQAAGNFWREVVADFEIRREDHSLMHALPVEGTIERGVERKVPAADLFVGDRADFPRPRIDRKLAALIAHFLREAQANGPVPFFGDANARSNVIAHPLHTVAAAGVRENIEAHLEPVVEPV